MPTQQESEQLSRFDKGMIVFLFLIFTYAVFVVGYKIGVRRTDAEWRRELCAAGIQKACL